MHAAALRQREPPARKAVNWRGQIQPERPCPESPTIGFGAPRSTEEPGCRPAPAKQSAEPSSRKTGPSPRLRRQTTQATSTGCPRSKRSRRTNESTEPPLQLLLTRVWPSARRQRLDP